MSSKLNIWVFLLTGVIVIASIGVIHYRSPQHNQSSQTITDHDDLKIKQLQLKLCRHAENGKTLDDIELHQCLQHESEDIRYLALQCLSKNLSNETTHFLADRALHDPSPLIRSAAITLLADRKTAITLPSIVACLSDPYEEVQDSALFALIRNREQRAVPAIIESAKKKPPTQTQILALGKLGGSESVKFLAEILLTRPELSLFAASALAETGDEGLRSIMKMVKEERSDKELSTLGLVFSFYSKEHRKTVLKTLLSDPSDKVRSFGSMMLAKTMDTIDETVPSDQ